MFEASHHRVVQDLLTGRRRAGEQTNSSLAILEDRLERLKKASPAFAGVDFSPAVRNLAKRKAAVAVI